MKSKRNSTLELFRVILMLMVITLHYFYTGGVLDKIEPNSNNYILTWLIESLCIVSVNCYVMLSAWFLSYKAATWKKAVFISFQVLFYSIIIYAVLCLLDYQKFNAMTFITRYLFPISSGYDWFATVYIVYILLTPFLNKIGDVIDRKEFRCLLLILFVAFSGVPTLLFFSIDNLGVNGGYSLLWFMFLHLLIMYIRKYDVRFERWKCAVVYLSATIIPLFVKLAQKLVMGTEYWDFYRYNSATTVIGALALFMLFVQLPERHSRFWCVLGSTTFGVLLIHTQYTVRTEILWNRIVRPLDYINGPIGSFIAHLIVSVFGIFLVCSLIDLGRQYFFQFIKWLYKRVRINA